MTGGIGTKINQILQHWPHGTVAATPWLESQGAYHQLVREYERSEWIERIGSGAFKKAGDNPDWLGAIYAIQSHLKLPIHPAAKTALALHGIVQYVPLGKNAPICLFGSQTSKLPLWFTRYDWSVRPCLIRSQLFGTQHDLGLTEISHGAFAIRASSRERAAIELCSLVPNQQSFAEAKELIEGLQTLRPSLVQTLLETCHSIKAKRLFLHLASACNLPWQAEIDLSKIELGRGKRSIAKGGVYDSKYQLIVPKIHEGGADDPSRP
jgi:hypothetical protein